MRNLTARAVPLQIAGSTLGGTLWLLTDSGWALVSCICLGLAAVLSLTDEAS